MLKGLKTNKKQVIMCFVGIVLFVCYTLLLYKRYIHIGLTSDFANLTLEAADVLDGNFFRTGWNLTGISFFTTDLVYFMLGVLFAGGVSARAGAIAFALMVAALTLASVLLVKDYFGKDFDSLVKAFVFVICVMLPGVDALGFLCAHTGVFVLGFVGLYFINKVETEQKKKAIWAVDLLIVLGMLGDPIVAVIIVAPYVAWAFIAWMREEITTLYGIKVLLHNVISVAVGMVIDKLYYIIGGANKNDAMSGKTFQLLEELSDKFTLYIRCILGLMDGQFEGKDVVSAYTPFFVVNILLLVVGLYFLVKNIVCQIIGKKYDIVTVLFGYGFFAMSLLFIMTNFATDTGNSRYICFMPAMMGVVIIRNFKFDIVTLRFKLIVLLALVFTVGIKGVIISQHMEGTPSKTNLVKTLSKNDLGNGYASFWNASLNTVYTKGKTQICSMSMRDGLFKPYTWFSKADWYDQEAHYVITSEDDDSGLTYENITNLMGEPDKVIESDKYQILVYDEDISKYVWNGLYDNVLNYTEWYADENCSYGNQSIVVASGSSLWGPYSKLEAGTYKVTCYGTNIDDLLVGVFSNTYGGFIQNAEAIGEDGTFTFTLTGTVEDVEIKVANQTDHDGEINYFEFEKVNE